MRSSSSPRHRRSQYVCRGRFRCRRSAVTGEIRRIEFGNDTPALAWLPRSDTIPFNNKSNECAFEIVCRNYYIAYSSSWAASHRCERLLAQFESILARKMNVVHPYFRSGRMNWKCHGVRTLQTANRSSLFPLQLKLRPWFPLSFVPASPLSAAFVENKNKVLHLKPNQISWST